jgi:hypothetical protein
MSRISTGWRLAKASFGVLRADRSLAIFPLVSIACATVAFVLICIPGVVIAEGVDQDWTVIPFLLAAAYAATFLVVYFNVALAGAARLSIEGRDTKLRDGLAVARERRGVIAKWAAVQLAVGLLISALENAGGSGVGRLALSLVAGLASVAWSVATFFVVPLIALEGLGPGAALKRSTAVVRERWGESLVGSAAIGLVVFLVAVLPLAGLFFGADALLKVNDAAGTALALVAILALIATFVVSSVLSLIFRVELYRWTTEGSATRGFAESDLAAAFRARGKPTGHATTT